MHSIERYGIVALLFLVVTVVAVLMWDGEKKKDKRIDEAGPAVPVASAGAAGPGLDEEAAARRLTLFSGSQPGPLARKERLAAQPEEADAGHDETEAPLEAQASSDADPAALVDDGAQPVDDAQDALPPQSEPVRESLIGQAPPAAGREYLVRAGDTLSEIAQSELGTARRWREIVAANPGLDPAKLRVGKRLRIPGPAPASAPHEAEQKPKAASAPRAGEAGDARKTWKVGKGENLWKIAERALGDGKRWREIAALNPRIDPDRLELGQVLTLPAATAVAAKPARSSGTKAAAAPRPKDGAKTLVASTEHAPRRGSKVK